MHGVDQSTACSFARSLAPDCKQICLFIPKNKIIKERQGSSCCLFLQQERRGGKDEQFSNLPNPAIPKHLEQV